MRMCTKFVVPLFCSLTLAIASVGSSRAAEVKLGILVPTTGQEADAGQDMENAIKLAVDEANAKGGVLGNRVTTVTADDACDPQQGAIAGSKLVSSGVTAIVGGYCSGATLPTLKLFGDAGLPFVIVAANSSKIVAANPGTSFLINSTADAQVETALGLFKASGVKSLAIVDQGDAYSSDLAKLTAAEFTKAGGKVAAQETVAPSEQDFSALVSRIRSVAPDAVFWTGYYGGGAPLVRQLRQGGVRARIVLGDANNTPEFLKIAGSAADGALILSPPVLAFLPEGEAFRKAYVAAYKREPAAYAALAYDAAKLALGAIERAGATDGKAILASIKASDHKGIAGPIAFTPKNTLVGSNFSVLVNQAGKWVLAK